MINNIINNTNSGINNNTNNTQNGDEGITNDDNLTERFRRWEQDLDHTSSQQSFGPRQNTRGFRSVTVQNNLYSNSNNTFNLPGNTVNNFSPLMPNSWDGNNRNNDMMVNNPIGNTYGKFNDFSVRNNTSDDFKTNDFSTTNFGPKDMSNVFMNTNTDYTLNNIVPAPVYKNYGSQNVDTSCHYSKVGAQDIQTSLTKMLETILETNELKIDFQVDEKNIYEFCGRIYTSSSTDFCVKIYQLKEKDNKGNISVIEIRNIFGDEFGFYELEKVLLEKLENEKIILKEDDEKDLFGFSIGSLTLDDEDEEDDDDFGVSDNDEDETIIDENDEEFDNNLTEIILETLYNKDSFREEYMHDAYQLATYLRKDNNRSKNMINYILKNESKTLLEKIIEPLKTKKFFCAFIILHVLEAVEFLVSNEDIKEKLNVPEGFMFEIERIEGIWGNDKGVENNIGPINVKFVKSQQIKKRCQSIINYLNGTGDDDDEDSDE